MHLKPTHCLSLLSATGVLLPLVAGAQDLLEELNPLVVTAARMEEELLDSAHTVNVLTADDIRQDTRRTLPEALQFTPGVLVQKTAHGHDCGVHDGGR